MEGQGDAAAFPGLVAIKAACERLYPINKNPLQIMSRRKFWLGGPDPLDLISMYWNNGKVDGVQKDVAHWHYVTMGLSDLYGDGRVHPTDSEASGLGFELTFRLRCGGEDEESPPTWPGVFLQKLAKSWLSHEMRYGSKSPPSDGDIHCNPGLKKNPADSSGICRAVFRVDPQLREITTPHGPFKFMQVVGITDDEMRAAEEWNGIEIVDLIAARSRNQLLVTDLGRRSVFQTDAGAHQLVQAGITTSGSALTGADIPGFWSEWPQAGGTPCLPPQGIHFLPQEVPIRLNAVHIQIPASHRRFLRILADGRLRHGQGFVFQLRNSDMISFIAPGGTRPGGSANGSPDNPYVLVPKPNYCTIYICVQSQLIDLLSGMGRSEDITGEDQSLGFKISVI